MRKKIVYITTRFPIPIDKGDKLRAYYQLKYLNNYYDIKLICFGFKNISQDELTKINEICNSFNYFKLNKLSSILSLVINVFYNYPFQIRYFYNKKTHKKINQIIDDYKPNHIFCQMIRISEYVKYKFDIPKTLDYMDALSKGMERRSKLSNFLLRNILKIESERLKNYEQKIFEYFDNKIIISEYDRDFIYHEENYKIGIIKNGIDTDYYKYVNSNDNKEYELIFNGNMQYFPNIQAVKYIAKKIIPLLKLEFPEIKLLISGASPSKEVMNLENKNIIVSGWQSDIRTAYSSAKILIAPMFIGTGLQNKLLEAMSMGNVCVSTSLANNALGAKPNNEILIGDNEQELANHIIKLLKDDYYYNEIKKNAHNFVLKNYNWQNINKAMQDIIG